MGKTEKPPVDIRHICRYNNEITTKLKDADWRERLSNGCLVNPQNDIAYMTDFKLFEGTLDFGFNDYSEFFQLKKATYKDWKDVEVMPYDKYGINPERIIKVLRVLHGGYNAKIMNEVVLGFIPGSAKPIIVFMPYKDDYAVFVVAPLIGDMELESVTIDETIPFVEPVRVSFYYDLKTQTIGYFYNDKIVSMGEFKDVWNRKHEEYEKQLGKPPELKDRVDALTRYFFGGFGNYLAVISGNLYILKEPTFPEDKKTKAKEVISNLFAWIMRKYEQIPLSELSKSPFYDDLKPLFEINELLLALEKELANATLEFDKIEGLIGKIAELGREYAKTVEKHYKELTGKSLGSESVETRALLEYNPKLKGEERIIDQARWLKEQGIEPNSFEKAAMDYYGVEVPEEEPPWRRLMDVIKELEKEYGLEVLEDIAIATATEVGIEKPGDLIYELKRDGILYSPAKGLIARVEMEKEKPAITIPEERVLPVDEIQKNAKEEPEPTPKPKCDLPYYAKTLDKIEEEREKERAQGVSIFVTSYMYQDGINRITDEFEKGNCLTKYELETGIYDMFEGSTKERSDYLDKVSEIYHRHEFEIEDVKRSKHLFDVFCTPDFEIALVTYGRVVPNKDTAVRVYSKVPREVTDAWNPYLDELKSLYDEAKREAKRVIPEVAPPYELIKKERLSPEELEQLKADITEVKRVRELWREKLPGYEAKQAIVGLDRDIADYEAKLKEFEEKLLEKVPVMVEEAKAEIEERIESLEVPIEIIKKGDIITDGLVRGIVLGEGTIGKRIPAYKILITAGHEKGRISAMVKDQARLVSEPLKKEEGECKWECDEVFKGCMEGREGDKELCYEDCENKYEDKDSEDYKKCIKKCDKEYEEGVEWCENEGGKCFEECEKEEAKVIPEKFRELEEPEDLERIPEAEAKIEIPEEPEPEKVKIHGIIKTRYRCPVCYRAAPGNFCMVHSDVEAIDLLAADEQVKEAVIDLTFWDLFKTKQPEKKRWTVDELHDAMGIDIDYAPEFLDKQRPPETYAQYYARELGVEIEGVGIPEIRKEGAKEEIKARIVTPVPPGMPEDDFSGYLEMIDITLTVTALERKIETRIPWELLSDEQRRVMEDRIIKRGEEIPAEQKARGQYEPLMEMVESARTLAEIEDITAKVHLANIPETMKFALMERLHEKKPKIIYGPDILKEIMYIERQAELGQKMHFMLEKSFDKIKELCYPEEEIEKLRGLFKEE